MMPVTLARDRRAMVAMVTWTTVGREVVMLRGRGRGGGGVRRPRVAPRAGVIAVLAASVTVGCAVHNPTDLAQRPPAISTASPPTVRADGSAVFNRRAVARVIAQLGYGNAKPREKPPGPLRAFVAACRGTTAPCLNIFFFYRGRYVGAAMARPQSALSVRGQDGRLVRASVPGPTGVLREVRYFWTGAEVIGLTSTGTVTVVHTPSRTLS